MWSGLRELFGGLSERGRFWLAVVIIFVLLAVFVTMTVTGVEQLRFCASVGDAGRVSGLSEP